MGPFTYTEVGATREPGQLPPPGYRLVDVSVPVGAGGRVFAVAGRAVLEWRMHRRMGVAMDADSPVAVPGARVVVGLGVGPWRLRAPCEVVWTVRDEHRIGFAYGTLPGHPECGEESFVVERGTDGVVRLRVTAFSRPAAWYTRAAGPWARAFQRAYARRCGQVLRRLAAREAGGPGR